MRGGAPRYEIIERGNKYTFCYIHFLVASECEYAEYEDGVKMGWIDQNKPDEPLCDGPFYDMGRSGPSVINEDPANCWWYEFDDIWGANRLAGQENPFDKTMTPAKTSIIKRRVTVKCLSFDPCDGSTECITLPDGTVEGR